MLSNHKEDSRFEEAKDEKAVLPREELLVVQLLGELRLTLRRMNVLARILSKLYIQAMDPCGLGLRLILTYRYDPEARLTGTYRIRGVGDL